MDIGVVVVAVVDELVVMGVSVAAAVVVVVGPVVVDSEVTAVGPAVEGTGAAVELSVVEVVELSVVEAVEAVVSSEVPLKPGVGVAVVGAAVVEV